MLRLVFKLDDGIFTHCRELIFFIFCLRQEIHFIPFRDFFLLAAVDAVGVDAYENIGFILICKLGPVLQGNKLVGFMKTDMRFFF